MRTLYYPSVALDLIQLLTDRGELIGTETMYHATPKQGPIARYDSAGNPPAVSQALSYAYPSAEVWYSRQGWCCVVGGYVILRLVKTLSVPEIEQAVSLSTTFCPEAGFCPYSLYGAMSRIVSDVSPTNPPLVRWLRDTTPCIHAIPGNYGEMSIYDISACYFTLLSSLISPVIGEETDGTLSPARLRRDKQVIWGGVVETLRENKELRNKLFGVCFGKRYPETTATYWKNGKQQRRKMPRSPASNAAGLVYHLAADVMWQATIETGSPYTCVDCVMSQKPPQIWEEYGLAYKVKNHGKTNRVYNQSCYRIGAELRGCDPTDRDKFYEPSARSAFAEYQYLRA